MSGAVRSINCTSCGAGLSVLGGGRVRARVCEYCGAVLDAQHDFKVLATYRDMPRPSSPFRIGMEGEIDGVRWQVIGTLGRLESVGGTWRWVEHQLYSPTHGYCWLSVEQNHIVFSRKIRQAGSQGWFDPARIDQAENPPWTYVDGSRFRYYESGSAVIEFVEGSFNWVPRRGDRNVYVSLLGDTSMITHVQSGSEREVERSHYLDPQMTLRAFDARAEGKPVGVHPLQPYVPWRHAAFTRNAGFAAAAVAAVLTLLAYGAGNEVLRLSRQSVAQPVAGEFALTNARDLVRIDLESNVDNSWAAYDLEVLDAEGETVVEIERGTEYYHGVEGGERWSEGSRRASVRLRLPAPGRYRLLAEQSEAAVDWSGGRAASWVSIRVIEGVKSPMWLVLATLLSAGAAALFVLTRLHHHSLRWAGSDWEDEDD
jgi:hypothetical protein